MLNNLVTSQSLMLATNGLMLVIGVGLHHRIRFDRARAQSGSSGRCCLGRALSAALHVDA